MDKTTLTIDINGELLDFASPKVMGIINVTPDSFYVSGRTFHKDSARERIRMQVEEGADIIDIGGYSSRPGAEEVSADEEYRRLAIGLEIIRSEYPEIPVSVDTFRSEVARKCVEQWNVDIINDIGGGSLDPAMFDTVADLKVAYVLMHMRGTPATMQSYTDYDDVIADVISDLAFKARRLHELGVCDVIVDPGFGFAKTVEQNYRLMSALPQFSLLGMPLLVGISHKTMLWHPLGLSPEDTSDATVALDSMALMLGADIIRVHEVRPAVESVKIYNLLKNNSI